MSMYFFKTTEVNWRVKNKLQEEAQKIAHDVDRKLVKETKLDEFIEGLYGEIEKLNQKHYRCTPLQLQRFDSPIPINDYDKFFFIDGVFHIAIFKAKRV
jgi:hypothetical protein